MNTMTSVQRMQVISNHLRLSGYPAVKRTSAKKKYIYTVDNNVLTQEQREFYEKNGYILIKNLVDCNYLDECKQRFVDICNGKIEKGQIVLMQDKSLRKTGVKGEYLINKAQDIMWDCVFEKYVLDPKILNYIECFTGPNISTIHSMLVNKPPDSGKLTSIHPVHQDLFYFPYRPAERIVASWTAMEKVTAENGCLFVIPGTHKSILQCHRYPEYDVNFAFYEIQGFDLLPKVMLEMEKGDTVFFHPLLMHGSGPNFTKGFRKAISAHFASTDCYYCDEHVIDKKGLVKDISQMSKKKGFDMTYKEHFRSQQKYIKGNKTGRIQE